MKEGLLLINLGTPNQPSFSAVWRYLGEFLADKRVITWSAPLRYLLLYGLILPFRTRQSVHAYQSIWTEEGAPLLQFSQKLKDKLQTKLKKTHVVALGMRYGTPSLQNALSQLQACETITVLPLYPQYASSSTGSALEKLFRLLAPSDAFPSLKIIRDFYAHPGFVQAQAAQIKPYLTHHDYLLLSYHGLPESHLKKEGCNPVCHDHCPSPQALHRTCYRAQCQQTSALLAEVLKLNTSQYTTSFQSRLGKAPWIKPYTDQMLSTLLNRGIKRLAIACPSFVTDCLETQEEIHIQLHAQWIRMGGEQLTLIPSLNDNDDWVSAIIDLIKPRKSS